MAKNKRISRTKQRWILAAVLLFCCLFEILATVVSVEMLYRGIVLHAYGQPAEAEVTRATTVRRGRRSGNSRYVLHYRFRVPGSDRWYTHTDVLTHAEARVGVSRPVFEEARKTGRIAVTYYPANPAINRPTDHTPLDGLVCPIIMTGFITVLTLATCVSLADECKELRRETRGIVTSCPATQPSSAASVR